MDVPLDDEFYIQAHKKMEEIIKKNLSTIQESLKIYNKYSFIMQDKEVS